MIYPGRLRGGQNKSASKSERDKRREAADRDSPNTDKTTGSSGKKTNAKPNVSVSSSFLSGLSFWKADRPDKAAHVTESQTAHGQNDDLHDPNHESSNLDRTGRAGGTGSAEHGGIGDALAPSELPANKDKVDLMYDPILGCYYDPEANQYYHLKGEDLEQS